MKKILLLLSLFGPILGISAMESRSKRLKLITERPPAMPIPFLANQPFLKTVKIGNKDRECHAKIAEKSASNGRTSLPRLAKKKSLEKALFMAIEAGDENHARVLIKRGANLNAKNENGYTCIVCAIMHGDLKICELLIENGADLKAESKWKTPLAWAAFYGHLEICKLLIEKGADVNTWDDPLHIAGRNGYLEICELLIANGAGVNAKHNHGKTLLHTVASEGNLEVCKLLIENVADVNAKNRSDETALARSASHGHLEICKLLMNQALIGGQVEAAKERLYTLLGCLQRIAPLPKGVRALLLSYDKEVLPHFISQLLKGNNKIFATVIDHIIPVLQERITHLKQEMAKAKKKATTRTMRNLLDPDLFEENLCCKLSDTSKKRLGLSKYAA